MPSNVNKLIVFGFGMLVAGILWTALDQSATDSVVDDYYIEGKGYLDLMSIGNNVGPLILFLIGGITLLIGWKIQGGFG